MILWCLSRHTSVAVWTVNYSCHIQLWSILYCLCFVCLLLCATVWNFTMSTDVACSGACALRFASPPLLLFTVHCIFENFFHTRNCFLSSVTLWAYYVLYVPPYVPSQFPAGFFPSALLPGLAAAPFFIQSISIMAPLLGNFRVIWSAAPVTWSLMELSCLRRRNDDRLNNILISTHSGKCSPSSSSSSS